MAVVHQNVAEAAVGLIDTELGGITRILNVWVVFKEVRIHDELGEGAADRVLVANSRPLRLVEGRIRVAKDLAKIVQKAGQMEPIVLRIRVQPTTGFGSLIRVNILRLVSVGVALVHGPSREEVKSLPNAHHLAIQRCILGTSCANVVDRLLLMKLLVEQRDLVEMLNCLLAVVTEGAKNLAFLLSTTGSLNLGHWFCANKTLAV